MQLVELIPDHWLFLPLAVFGFLSSLWLFVLVLINLNTKSSKSHKDRLIRTWIDGKEVELLLGPVHNSSARSNSLSSLFSSSTPGQSPKAFISQAAMLVGFTFVFALLWSRSLVVAVVE